MQKEFLPYVRLVEFLGKVLGRHTEVVLHDLTNLDQSIIAIANGHISGRKVGAPATDLALRIVSNEALKQKDYLCKYTGYAKNGYKLCSSTFFIRDGSERLIGMLCINTDSERLEQARDILDSMLSDRDCCCQNGATEDISEKLPLNAE
ncbi:MAG TPA: PAS domain-containing protein [Clostridia bacterium]|nr:PAS domain-containing protein [Clostridia bacterium]